MNNVSTVLRPLADLVKTMEAAKGRKESVPWLAFVPTLVIGTLPKPALSYVLLLTCLLYP